MNLLEVDGDFAKRVAVPTVSNIDELATVLQQSPLFNFGDVSQVIGRVQERTISDQFVMGIKAIQDCIFEARAGGTDCLERFIELLVSRADDMM